MAATVRGDRTPIMKGSKANDARRDAGLWPLGIGAAAFVIFAFSFTKPKTSRDWRSFGAFSAFIVALFTEMYGFPLTIYLLSGWLTRTYPGIDPFSQDAGHLWSRCWVCTETLISVCFIY